MAKQLVPRSTRYGGRIHTLYQAIFTVCAVSEVRVAFQQNPWMIQIAPNIIYTLHQHTYCTHFHGKKMRRNYLGSNELGLIYMGVCHTIQSNIQQRDTVQQLFTFSCVVLRAPRYVYTL